jgi:hypothetical protein
VVNPRSEQHHNGQKGPETQQDRACGRESTRAREEEQGPHKTHRFSSAKARTSSASRSIFSPRPRSMPTTRAREMAAISAAQHAADVHMRASRPSHSQHKRRARDRSRSSKHGRRRKRERKGNGRREGTWGGGEVGEGGKAGAPHQQCRMRQWPPPSPARLSHGARPCCLLASASSGAAAYALLAASLPVTAPGESASTGGGRQAVSGE